MKVVSLVYVLLLIFSSKILAQFVPGNANNRFSLYNNVFTIGFTSSYYEGLNNGTSSVRDVVTLVSEANIKGVRTRILDQFMSDYGPTYEKNNIKFFKEVQGMKVVSLILDSPSNMHRSTDSISCDGVKYRSNTFAHLYERIWDDSVSGVTPINDNNFYAKYVYQLAKNY
jgi:hypothetical protein